MSETRKYRKKPVVIDAIQWTGDNLCDIIAFTGRHPSAAEWSWEHFEEVVKRDGLIIFTLEGKHLASVGDYIIRGVKGEFYPCKPDIFAATYEDAAAPAVDGDAVREALIAALDVSELIEVGRLCFALGVELSLTSKSETIKRIADALLSRSRPEAAPGGETAEAEYWCIMFGDNEHTNELFDFEEDAREHAATLDAQHPDGPPHVVVRLFRATPPAVADTAKKDYIAGADVSRIGND